MGAALRLGQEPVRWLEGLHDGCGPVSLVDGDDLALGESISMEFGAAAVLRAMGCVVEERDHLFWTILRDKTCMVLEAEGDVGAQLKVRALAT